MKLHHLGLTIVILSTAVAGCTFKFDITSQRTALENQVMGSYKEIDDDVVLMASVRGVSSEGNVKKNEVSDLQLAALQAKQNQEFNRDDVDELKASQILGETKDGTLAMLPDGIGLAAKATASVLAFSRVMVEEENRDRRSIWGRIVQSNQNLSAKDLPEVQKTYAKMQLDAAPVGHWYQDEKGAWRQKTASAKQKEDSSK